MNTLLLAFLLAAVGTLLVLRYRHLHIPVTGDHDFSGIQRFHSVPVPRVGSIGIFLGVLLALVIRYFIDPSSVGIAGPLLLVTVPAMFVGLLEDLTKRVGVMVRLGGCLISALLAGHFLDSWISALQIIQIDDLVSQYFWVSLLFTCFAIVGLTNAFNVIDGYNGLSGMVGVITLGAICYVAFRVSDVQVMVAALVMIGGILGFLVFNYPRGLIFLGDGGAYLIGFWVAVLSILLTNRHPEISKWFPLMLVIYPVTETLFSVYRRLIVQRGSAVAADAKHLHHLIYEKTEDWLGFDSQDRSVARNSVTSQYLWAIATVSVIPAVMFWNNVWALRLSSILFIVAYIYLYRNLSKELN